MLSHKELCPVLMSLLTIDARHKWRINIECKLRCDTLDLKDQLHSLDPLKTSFVSKIIVHFIIVT